jgi:hypothetical protein
MAISCHDDIIVGGYTMKHPHSLFSLIWNTLPFVRHSTSDAAGPTCGLANAQTYANPLYSWTISYPQDWQIDNKDLQFVKILPEVTIAATVSIQTRINSVGYRTIDDFVNSIVAYRELFYSRKEIPWKLISKKETTMHGMAAIDFIEETGDGKKTRTLCTMKDDLTFCADAETLVKEWDNFSPAFETILGSFVVKGSS